MHSRLRGDRWSRPFEPDVDNANEGSAMTQMDAARAGTVTDEMHAVAVAEHRSDEFIRDSVAKGTIAIPVNPAHKKLRPCGVGAGLRTKVNVNLGISGDIQNAPEEWEKVRIAEECGGDAIMDLSNFGKTRPFRRELIAKTPLMVGTVPIYDVIGYKDKPLVELTAQDFLDVVEAHAEDGVDFMTIHAGFNRSVLNTLLETKRLTNVVSRGGSLLFAWMMTTGEENPFYEHFDEVLEILHDHDVTISLGDAMRGGSTYDATDACEVSELVELGKLTTRAWEKGVQVVVEGPGHMALDEIQANMKLQKRLCHGAPFYVLGPLVTDIAPGYDHITAAIGGAVAASTGADWLCYVTPAEHLKLPNAKEVREGLIVTRIAAHAADIAKGIPGARDIDNKMSDARRRVDWDGMFECAIDADRAKEIIAKAPPEEDGTCTMCGKMCAARTVNRIMAGLTVDLG